MGPTIRPVERTVKIYHPQTKYNWPGWALTDNEHGHDFDGAARERMVNGGAALVPYLNRFCLEMGASILEIGPFFNPLTRFIEEQISYKSIAFWENDHNVIQWLGATVFAFSHTVEDVDVNSLASTNSKVAHQSHQYDSVIASQNFNYIDYRDVLSVLNQCMTMDGLIFINNVIDYGLPAYFSDNRPTSIGETLETLETVGFQVVDYDIIPTVYPEHQSENRLVVVGQKTR